MTSPAGLDSGWGRGHARAPAAHQTAHILFLANESADDLYRCFIAICKCYYALKLQRRKILPLPKYDFWMDLRGGVKNFLGSLLLAIFYVPLIHYDIILPLPQTP